MAGQPGLARAFQHKRRRLMLQAPKKFSPPQATFGWVRRLSHGPAGKPSMNRYF